MIRPAILFLAAIYLTIFLSFAEEEEDEFQGLPPGVGQEEVFYACSACHSLKIVQQQRLTKKVWDETLDWMVEEQGMGGLEEEERVIILNYLFANFGFRPEANKGLLLK